jgi:hypothetical protein
VGCQTNTTVTAASGFTNAGTIELTGTGGGCNQNTTLAVTSGAITNTGALTYDTGTIGGSREVLATVTSSGTVAVTPGTTALFDGSGKVLTSTGNLTVGAAGALQVLGATLDNAAGSMSGTGQVDVTANGTYVQGNGSVTGTTVVVGSPGNSASLDFTGTGAASITVESAVTLAGDIAAGQTLTAQSLGCQTNTTVTAASGFTNAGSIVLTGAGGGCNQNTTLAVTSGTLTNAGTLTVATGTIGGSRQVQGNVTNTGTADITGTAQFNGTGTTFDNQGTLNVSNTAVLQVTGAALSDTSGTIAAAGTGQVQVSGNGTYLQGGGSTTGTPVLVGSPGNAATVDFTGAGAATLDLEGTITLAGNVAAGQTVVAQSVGCQTNTTVTAASGFTNAGTIELTGTGGGCNQNTTLAVGTGASLVNAGTLETVAGTIGGARAVTGTVVNAGTVVPAIGVPLAVTGTYTQGANGTLDIPTNASGQSGQLTVNGTAQLGGTVTTTGPLLVAGTNLVVLTASSLTGTFTMTSFAVQGFTPVYGTSSVTLVAGLPNVTVTFTAAPNPVTAGVDLILTATVAPVDTSLPTPTGTVSFLNGANTLGTVPLVTGTATLDVTSLPAGSYQLTASYSGDVNFGGGSSAPLAVTVNPSSTTTTSSSTSTSSSTTSTTSPTTSTSSSTTTMPPSSTTTSTTSTSTTSTSTTSTSTTSTSTTSTSTTSTSTSTTSTSTTSTSTSTSTTSTTSTSTTTSTTSTTMAPANTTTTTNAVQQSPPPPVASVPGPPSTAPTTTTPTTTSPPTTVPSTSTTRGPSRPALLPGSAPPPPPPPQAPPPPAPSPPGSPQAGPPSPPVLHASTGPPSAQAPPPAAAPPVPPSPGAPSSGGALGTGGTDGGTPPSPQSSSARAGAQLAAPALPHTAPVLPAAHTVAGTTGSDATRDAGAPKQRSFLVRSIPTPAQVSWDLKSVGRSASLALLLLLLITIPSELFNSTMGSNYDEVIHWFGGLHRHLVRAEAAIAEVPTWVVASFFALVASVLYALVEPGFGLNSASVALVIGLALALVVTTATHELGRGIFLDRRYGKRGHLTTYPGGIVVAVVLVAFSKLSHFEPGFLFGLFTGLRFAEEPERDEDGHGLAISAIAMMLIALAAWFLWVPVRDRAVLPHANFVTLVADALLSTLWVSGIGAVIFGLVPIRFLDGERVVAWSRARWLAIYGVGMFFFVQTVLHPDSHHWGGSSAASLGSVLVVFGVFAFVAVVFWAYFRFRPERAREPVQVPAGGDPER